MSRICLSEPLACNCGNNLAALNDYRYFISSQVCDCDESWYGNGWQCWHWVTPVRVFHLETEASLDSSVLVRTLSGEFILGFDGSLSVTEICKHISNRLDVDISRISLVVHDFDMGLANANRPWDAKKLRMSFPNWDYSMGMLLLLSMELPQDRISWPDPTLSQESCSWLDRINILYLMRRPQNSMQIQRQQSQNINTTRCVVNLGLQHLDLSGGTLRRFGTSRRSIANVLKSMWYFLGLWSRATTLPHWLAVRLYRTA